MLILTVTNSDHIHEDDLELYAVGRLEFQHAGGVELHLSRCEACQQALSRSIGLHLIARALGKTKSGRGPEKRADPRFGAGDSAIVQEISPLSLERHAVQIVDVSKNGLGIFGPKSLMPGTVVQIRIKDKVELGEVRHCSAGDRGYRIGVRLHAG